MATTEAAFTGELLTGNTTSFTTTLTGVGTLPFEQSLFVFSLESAVPVDVGQALQTIEPSSTFAATVASRQPMAQASPQVSSRQMALQTVERDLLNVRAYAQVVISQLMRDVAIDLSHAESEFVSAVEGVAVPCSGPGSAAAMAAAVVAGTFLQNRVSRDKQKPNVNLSNRLNGLGLDW